MLKTLQKIVCAFHLVFFILLPAFPAGITGWVKESVKILPEVSYDGDFKIYTLQKNDYFREKYSCEQNMNADLAFVSIKDRFYWMFRPELKAGLGDSQSGMVLHPYDVSFGLIPTFEYRFDKIHVESGLDHRCFHVIDQRPPEPIVYWNKFIIGFNSPHRRIHPLACEYIRKKWNLSDRLIWNFTWGYYISDFFGIVQPCKLMTLERPHYLHDFTLKAKCSAVDWKWGTAMITETSMLGYKKGGSTYWSQEFGLETLFACRNFDPSLFLRYTFDGGCFNSKDRLLEFGISVSK